VSSVKFIWTGIWVGAILMICSCFTVARPDNSNDINGETLDTLQVLFQQGVKYFNEERYWDALNIFEQLNSITKTENRLLSASGLMLIKTYFRLGELDHAIQFGLDYVRLYKTSKYLDDAEYALGEAYLVYGSYEQAILYYLDVMQITDQQQLYNLSKQTVEMLIDLFISTENLVELRDNCGNDFQRIFLSLKLAEKYHSDGDSKKAESEMRSLRSLIKGSDFMEEYNATMEQLRNRAREKIYIGVVLPLSGPMADVGESILNGVRYALHQFRANSDKDITAIVVDNRSEVVESIRKVEYLCNNPKVKAIFGPVSSENTIAAAAVANQHNVPLIAPTATSSEISSLGPYVFQANVDYENLGQFIGNYGAKAFNFKTVATLSPADEFGKEMTDAFCIAVDNAGGQIVSQQWYHDSPVELKYQFSMIRQAGLEISRNLVNQKIEQSLVQLRRYVNSDSLQRAARTYVDMYGDKYRIFKEDNVYLVDQHRALILTGLMDSTEFLVPKEDSLEYRITSIDGLLVPAYASNLTLLIPQLEYYNLSAKIFGSANWNDPTLLKDHPKISQNLIFISDYYIDQGSRFYQNFERIYSRLLGAKPSRFDLYGYDTMRALLSVFDESDCSRETIRKQLSQMPKYSGICRNISFRGNRPRVNSCAFIMKFEDGHAVPIAAIENGDLVPYTPRY
jgi:ABC-type branched-subunit amino acid transport system substrate-binding protein